MVKKILFFLLFFYFLTLFQVSFFVQFSFFGIIPNFVLLAVILVNLLASPHRWTGVLAGFIAGFYLDVFSLSLIGFFGFYTLISVAISLFFKFVVKRYVQVPDFSKS